MLQNFLRLNSLKRYTFFFMLLAGYGGPILAQQIELSFTLIDQESGKPIIGAHLFINDASNGTISDEAGKCQLTVPYHETQDLIITHIAYETLVFSKTEYEGLVADKPVFMHRNDITLTEIEISAKRGRTWKKNYKKFKKALLGTGRAAAKCNILNPEVLRFEEKDGDLTATATNLLEIENKYLDYHILFLLDELTIKKDGSEKYQGYSHYTEMTNDEDSRIYKRRANTYEHSLAHFLLALRSSPDKKSLREKGYHIELQRYTQGQFVKIMEPDPTDLFTHDSITGLTQLYFPEFLTVHHLNIKIKQATSQKVSVSAAEQQRYGSNNTQTLRTASVPAISRLFKIEPYLTFDHRGNIINKSAVKEYGYWAEQRLSTTLPIDYNQGSETKLSVAIGFDTLQVFKDFIEGSSPERIEASDKLKSTWTKAYVAPLLDILLLSGDDFHQIEIQKLLDKHVPDIESDYYKGIQWLWAQPPHYGSYYPDLKAYLYKNLDPAFVRYFDQRVNQSLIRIDEVVWGGVKQDGIPPLRNPKMIHADQAGYLGDRDIIFGFVLNGKAYAYPKRILAWHEFFTDEIDSRSIAGVYCTLCGTMIIYDTDVNGVKYQLGTSGFLYRSNKLMYDYETKSLWSTLLGRPVVGPLIDQGIELDILPVVTTTWENWLKEHPETMVLSLNTGYTRNYNEGEAYKDYFATDALMFPVPSRDKRLRNKDRILIPTLAGYKEDPLGVSVSYLKDKRIHHDRIGSSQIIILANKTGASRVYAIEDQKFTFDKDEELLDETGSRWTITEDHLIGPNEKKLKRVPAHESFWFAWYNVFPETRLVK
jgi:hypothetical protein